MFKTFISPLFLMALGFASMQTIADNHQLPSSVTIETWQVPWQHTRPRDPMLDSNGRVWFCGQAGNYIGRLNPGTGEFTRFELSENTNPHNLIIDSKDNVWYAGNQNAHIGKLDPESGEVTRYPMPEEDAKDPHTLVFDSSGNIWFTVQWGNYIGYLDTQTGDVELYNVPVERARPYGIKLDNRGQPWVALLGTNKLATVSDKQVILIDLPDSESRPRRLEIDANNTIWYSDYAGGKLGHYDPASGDFSQWVLPTGVQSYPYATALDQQGRIWLSDTSAIPNQLIGFSLAEKKFISQTEVGVGGHIRHTYVAPNSDVIWFGTDSGYIAKATVKDN